MKHYVLYETIIANGHEKRTIYAKFFFRRAAERMAYRLGEAYPVFYTVERI